MTRDYGGKRRIALAGGRYGCGCQEEFLKELKRRLGYLPLVYQMGYNGNAVAASAGSHALGMDSDLRVLTYNEQKIAREIGTTSWNRSRAQGFSPHNHSGVIGCPHGAPLATWQISNYLNGNGNGLGHGQYRDDGPSVRKVKMRDYFAELDRKSNIAQQLDAKKAAAAKVKRLRATKIVIAGKTYAGISRVTVVGTVAARKSRKTSRYTWLVQGWLIQQGKSLTRDGRWGPLTQAAFDQWRRTHGFPDVKTGPPGLSSLKKLATAAKSPYSVTSK